MKGTVAATASAMVTLCSCGTNAFTTQSSFSAAARFASSPARPSAVSGASVRSIRPRVSMAVALPPPVAVGGPSPVTIDLEGVMLSGLNGLALQEKTFPSKREVIDVIPKHCFVKDTLRSFKYAAISCAITLSMGALAAVFIPLKLAMLPVWAAYAVACGTAATGAWVVAHECGHGAFSDNRQLQDAVGYVLHSLLLVPYFSWQRSHAVHHANTNHMENGETHVPELVTHKGFGLQRQRKLFRTLLGKRLGTFFYGLLSGFSHLVVGWPAYLMFGATGGPSRGVTSHFFPHPPFSTGEQKTDLFPGKWKKKVWMSNVGVAATIAGLALWASKVGTMRVAALYGAPLMVVNAWLVLITWLQHTEVDVPHFEAQNWSFIKGALHTIDRPYGKVLDFLHHRIGSTHVAHHVDCTIPHYHALEATNAIKAAFPQHYLYDPTPLPQATWRIAKQCAGVEKRGDMHVFVSKE
eukprot:jgi/Undpi1/14072/HiC_scaffold_9.g03723.m1